MPEKPESDDVFLNMKLDSLEQERNQAKKTKKPEYDEDHLFRRVFWACFAFMLLWLPPAAVYNQLIEGAWRAQRDGKELSWPSIAGTVLCFGVLPEALILAMVIYLLRGIRPSRILACVFVNVLIYGAIGCLIATFGRK